MKWLRVIGWVFIPYIMIFVHWKKLNKYARILAFIWIGIVAIVIATNSNSETETASNNDIKSTPTPISTPTTTSTPVPTSPSASLSEVTDKPDKPVAALGEPLTSFDEVLGKANVNETFHQYKDDYVLVMPLNELAWNITVQFEATDKKRRTKEEALEISKEFTPSDAVEIKQWEVEKGKDVIQFESKLLANKLDASIFGESPAGTFMVIVKSDDSGVYALVVAPGDNP